LSRDASIALSGLSNPSDINIFAPSTLTETADWLKQVNPLSQIMKPVEQSLDLFSLHQQDSAIIGLSEFAVHSNLTKIAEISALSESSLLNFKLDSIGEGIGISSDFKAGIGESLLSISGCYSDLFKSFQSSPGCISEIGPLLFRLTPVEYFNEVDLCKLISIEATPGLEIDFTRNEIFSENQVGLQQHLPRIDKELLRLWEGAKEALDSDNPDRVRHFSISIRELFTHLLHIVAPDNAIKKWTTDEKYYYEGKPTREARLMYICRDIDNGDFHKFIVKDVGATLEFMRLFQEGTHSIKSQMSDKQLMAIKARAESTIRYLIEIAVS
jgi:hypothetical protein